LTTYLALIISTSFHSSVIPSLLPPVADSKANRATAGHHRQVRRIPHSRQHQHRLRPRPSDFLSRHSHTRPRRASPTTRSERPLLRPSCRRGHRLHPCPSGHTTSGSSLVGTPDRKHRQADTHPIRPPAHQEFASIIRLRRTVSTTRLTSDGYLNLGIPFPPCARQNHLHPHPLPFFFLLACPVLFFPSGAAVHTLKLPDFKASSTAASPPSSTSTSTTF
jgi:hypothetical protein